MQEAQDVEDEQFMRDCRNAEGETIFEVSSNRQIAYVAPKQRSILFSLHAMLCNQSPEGIALYGVETGVDSVTRVTYKMITDAIRLGGNLCMQGIFRKYGRLQLDGDSSSCPIVAYVAPAGLPSALSFLVLGSQATLIPLSYNLSKEEISDSLQYVSDVIFVNSDLLTAPFVRTVMDACDAIGSSIKIHKAETTSRDNPFITFEFKGRDKNCEESKDENSYLITIDGLENGYLDSTASGTDIILLLRTSGTTSKSKLVPLLNQSVVANGSIIAESLAITSADIALNAMPLFHIGGLSANILAPLSVGGATIVLPSFNVLEFVDIIENGRKVFDGGPTSDKLLPRKSLRFGVSETSGRSGSANGMGFNSWNQSEHNSRYESLCVYESVKNAQVEGGSFRTLVKPTWYHAVPTMHATIVEYFSSRDLTTPFNHTLRFIRTGAANLPLKVGLRLSQIFGVRVVPSYSMTEQMPICQAPVDYVDLNTKVASVGRPVGVTVGIFDSSNNICPMVSEKKIRSIDDIPVGEICFNGYFMCSGYVNNPAANASSFFTTASGMTFFRSGDMGYLDKDGYLFLTGRSKEMIKRGGEQVSPFEVEEEIVRVCPFVKIALCFGVPDMLLGEQVGLVIVLNDPNLEPYASGSKAMHTKTIRSILKGRSALTPAKYPEHVIVVKSEDKLVKNATGKFVRIGLAKHLNCTSVDDPEVEVSHVTQEAAKESAVQSTMPAKLDLPFTTSPALKGVAFFLAAYVCWNHLYTQTAKPNSSRTWFHHEAMYFWLGGFNLASNNNCFTFDTARSMKNFYWRIYSSLLPIYWLSLLFVIIAFLSACNPNTYLDDFHYGRQVACQGTPVTTNWYVSFVLSVVLYVTTLQDFIIFTPITWFLHWYSWFLSVYTTLVLMFPFVQNHFLTVFKDEKWTEKGTGGLMLDLFKKTLLWAMLWAVFSVALLILYFYALHGTATAEFINWLTLGLYLLPFRWLASFAFGVAGYHILRIAHSRIISTECADWIGYGTDFLSYSFLIGMALFWGIPQEVTGLDISNTSISTLVTNRLYQCMLAQLLQPVTWFWMFGLAVGKGLTAKILSMHVFVEILGPCSYGMFLFQQTIGQLYFTITRPGAVWIIPKQYIWFSPAPLPIEFREFFAVMTILILFCIFIFPRLTNLVMPITVAMLSNVENEQGPKELILSADASPQEIVSFCVESVTGVEVVDGKEEIAMFLGSMDAVLLMAEINKYSPVPGVIKLPDILKAKLVADLQNTLADKLKEARQKNTAKAAKAGIFKGWN